VEAEDIAAVAAGLAAAVVAAAFVFSLLSLTRAATALRQAAEDLRNETLPVVAKLRETVANADAELERVDGLIGTAENVTATVDSASRLAYLALSNPVIKVLAFASGTGRAARRFRRTREG
jgi:hypothetical protein